MRVLVTGHRGGIGAHVATRLEQLGYEVVGFDLRDGADLRDLSVLTGAASGCSAAVHLGALAHDRAAAPEEIMAVNVLGTWHLLLAAESAGARRVVNFSSVQALGIAGGERLPDYFPVDDLHPRRATRPYGLSKRLAEDLCEAFTARTGIPTVSLRPVAAWNQDAYGRIAEQRRLRPSSEWDPVWEYGAFIDVRDVTAAVQRALEVPLSGHHRLLLCATEISGSATTLELVAALAPSVPVRDLERYRVNPRRALFDCTAAERLLGWRARHSADA
jgi:UDP-glucose 4-epimerase